MLCFAQLKQIYLNKRKKLPHAEAAFELAGNRKCFRALYSVPFCEGDIFTVPSTQNDQHWIAMPKIKGGEPILLLQIVMPRNGSSEIVDIYAGIFFRRGKAIDGSYYETVTYLKDGRTCKDIAEGCNTDGEFWITLLGKTFKIVTIKQASIKSHTLQGEPMTRRINFYTIEEI